MVMMYDGGTFYNGRYHLYPSQFRELTAEALSVGSFVEAASVTQLHNITPSAVVLTMHVGDTSISQVHFFEGVSSSSTSTVGTPGLTQLHSLAADPTTAASDTTDVAFSQEHGLSPAGLSVATSMGTSGVTEIYGISATDLTVAVHIGSAEWGSTAASASSVIVVSTTGTPHFSIRHPLDADGVSSVASIEVPNFVLQHTMEAVATHAQPRFVAANLGTNYSFQADQISIIADLQIANLEIVAFRVIPNDLSVEIDLHKPRFETKGPAEVLVTETEDAPIEEVFTFELVFDTTVKQEPVVPRSTKEAVALEKQDVIVEGSPSRTTVQEVRI